MSVYPEVIFESHQGSVVVHSFAKPGLGRDILPIRWAFFPTRTGHLLHDSGTGIDVGYIYRQEKKQYDEHAASLTGRRIFVLKERLHARTILIFLLVALTALPMMIIQASRTALISGDFTVISTMVTSARPIGRNCQIELDASFAFQGDLAGEFDAHFSILHFAPCDQQAAPEVFAAHGSYTGQVLGDSGSFDFNFVGHITDQGSAQGRLVILSGTGGLADLHGIITLTGQAGVGGSYTGFVR